MGGSVQVFDSYNQYDIEVQSRFLIGTISMTFKIAF